MLTREAEHFLATGRATLFYPVCESQARKIPSPRVLDLHPSPFGQSHISGKRASLLGKLTHLSEVVDEEGFRNEEIERDDPVDYGEKVDWLIDGEHFTGSDGSAHRTFPSEAEREQRRQAGMIVGARPQSIIRIPDKC